MCWISQRFQTDLGSVIETSRDFTNMEHRTEVEGSTWAGVWRSWHTKKILIKIKIKKKKKKKQTHTRICLTSVTQTPTSFTPMEPLGCGVPSDGPLLLCLSPFSCF